MSSHSLALAIVVLTIAAPRVASAQCVGEDCDVRPPSSSSAARRSTLDAAELLWPVAPPSLAGAVERPYLRRGRDMGLIGLGIGLLALGMGGQLAIGGIDQLAVNCNASRSFAPDTCDSWPFALVPFAGGILAGTVSMSGVRTSNGLGVVAGPLVTVPQIVGLVVLLFAVHGYTEEIVGSLDVAGVGVFPYVSASEAGLSLTGVM